MLRRLLMIVAVAIVSLAMQGGVVKLAILSDVHV